MARRVHEVFVLLPELVNVGGHVNASGVDVELGDDVFQRVVVLVGLPLGSLTPNLRRNTKYPSSYAEVVYTNWGM